MFRKIILSSLLIIPTYAWSIGPGFYLGGGVGADTVDFFENAHVVRSNVPKITAFNVINKTELAGEGVLGTAFAGYSWNYYAYYIAGEINGDISTAEFRTTNDEYVHKVFSQTVFKIRNYWGISLLPGILFTDSTLAYARLGYVDGNVKVGTSDTSLVNTSKMLNGFRFGFGIEQEIPRNMSFRLEYSHLTYQEFSMFTFDPVGRVAKTTRIFPDTNQVEFDFMYRFD